MLGIHDFGVFLATGIVLNLAPGPDTFYILGRSMAQGRSAGIASVLGISTGSLVHSGSSHRHGRSPHFADLVGVTR